MTVEEIVERLSGIVHEPTQTDGPGVDLTVAEVYEVVAPGHVDFGGGEQQRAERSPHERTWRAEDDEYGWWRLDGGQYLLEYNESLSGDGAVELQPRRELLECGGSHPSLRVETLPRVPLSVPDAGLHLKENARVSTLLP